MNLDKLPVIEPVTVPPHRLNNHRPKKERMSRRTKLHILGWILITLAFLAFIGIIVFGAIGIWNGDERFGGIGMLMILPAFVFGAIGGVMAAD